jgi:glyoxylase-like metal-dependent hydrolase (beta-lactamase superfamily II)
MTVAHLISKTIVVGPFQCNCRLLICPKTGDALIVDPGDEAEKILSELQKAERELGKPIRVKFLLHTHAHLDHIGATRWVHEKLQKQPDQKPDPESGQKNAPPLIALHSEDLELYQNLVMQGQLFGMHYEAPLPVMHSLQDQEDLRVGEMRLSVIHTPGHSPGSVSFRLSEDSLLKIPETVLTGDTLFQGSVGRTDLWGGNQETMFNSIRKRLLVLDDETRVCPGHGRDTTIGLEKWNNPFLQ